MFERERILLALRLVMFFSLSLLGLSAITYSIVSIYLGNVPSLASIPPLIFVIYYSLGQFLNLNESRTRELSSHKSQNKGQEVKANGKSIDESIDTSIED